MSITTTLPVDTQNRRFLGVGADGLLPDGVTTVAGRRATLYTLLVAADGTTPLIVASNADAVSNTQGQVPVSARLQAYNGTTWDRARGDIANGLDVDVTRLPALAAGSAIIGKAGIDQTTPGTTDSVSVATGQGAGAVIGTTIAGAAVTTDANGTLQQYLRGAVTILGAVTASPVANSIGDRLKSLLAKLPALGTAGTPSADVISVQGVALGTAQPVSLASVPSHAVTNAGTFAVQSTLQAGSAAIGKLAANSGVDIGDVDVTSLPYTSAISYSHAAYTMNTSAQVVAVSNVSRKYMFIQNDGAIDIFINVGGTAVAHQGIRLVANGGSYEMSAAKGNLSTAAVQAITPSSTAVIMITEA